MDTLHQGLQQIQVHERLVGSTCVYTHVSVNCLRRKSRMPWELSHLAVWLRAASGNITHWSHPSEMRCISHLEYGR